MATITESRVTPEDLLKIRDRPMPELIDGELVEREMSQKFDRIGTILLAFLTVFIRQNHLGWVNGAQGSYQIFPDDPKKVRVPDGSFTRRERLPNGPSDGHGQVVPDLVFEVISPNDSADELERKVVDFLAAGVLMIWIVSPSSRTVRVVRSDGTARQLKAEDTLEGEDIVPGFACPITLLFAQN